MKPLGDERRETLEQIALRIAPEYSDKDGRIVLIAAYTCRLVAELDKQAEPVATLKYQSGGVGFGVDIHAPDIAEAGMKLFLRPASTAEIEARALEEAATRCHNELDAAMIRDMAAAKREGK